MRRTKGGSYELKGLEEKIFPRRYPPQDLIPISNNNLFDDESYEIEKIVAHRNTDNGEFEYKVRWKGYSAAHDTWEPFANFDSIAPIDSYWIHRNSKSGGSDVVFSTVNRHPQHYPGHL